MSDGPHETLVDRPDVPVMFVATGDDQPAITRAWAELEDTVGSLRGRKFYGVFDPVRREYHACVERRPGDDPEAVGLELGTLPGGRYARERLRGEPPPVYALIAPTFERLAQRPDCDRQRPSPEFYRRRDVIDLLQPVIRAAGSEGINRGVSALLCETAVCSGAGLVPEPCLRGSAGIPPASLGIGL